jgi:choline kinase
MTKAVIIAAGRGERLLPLTRISPKPLIHVNGKPLIEHVFNTLRKSGIKECIVITGYMEHAFRKYLNNSKFGKMRIRCCYNPSYTRGNATSLKTAQRFLMEGEKFLLTMADHITSEEITKTALKNAAHAPLLCIDRQIRDSPRVNEATKVLVGEDGYIRNIGKEIPLWNALDTGVFLFTYKIFEVINLIKTKYSILTLTHCVKEMIKMGFPLWACDVSGNFWMDVDTAEDVALAERVLRSA